MSPSQAHEAISVFLHKILNIDSLLNRKDIINDSIKTSESGVRTFKIFELEDRSQWVLSLSNGFERFVGANYLQDVLSSSEISKVKVAKTKVCLKNSAATSFTISVSKGINDAIPVITSKDFVSFSEYLGEQKLTDPMDSLGFIPSNITNLTGYSDLVGFANIRLLPDGVGILDTEYGSFTANGLAEGTFSSKTLSELVGLEFTFSTSDFFNNSHAQDSLTTTTATLGDQTTAIDNASYG